MTPCNPTEIFNNITLIGKAVTSIESRFISRVLRTLTGLRKKMTKSAIKIALDQAFPKGCMLFLSRLQSLVESVCVCVLGCSAKTGQALIASDIFQSLPDSTASTSALDMEVDSAQPAATSPTPSIKKFNPPVDPSTQDLLPECIIYLRLLLILANLDAGRIHEVGHSPRSTAVVRDSLMRVSNV